MCKLCCLWPAGLENGEDAFVLKWRNALDAAASRPSYVSQIDGQTQRTRIRSWRTIAYMLGIPPTAQTTWLDLQCQTLVILAD